MKRSSWRVAWLAALGCACVSVLGTATQWKVGDEISPASKPPKQGFVPDEKTALAIARAVAVPLYDTETVADQEPLRATLYQGTWIVKGTVPEGVMGAALFLRIAKKDGRIITVTTR